VCGTKCGDATTKCDVVELSCGVNIGSIPGAWSGWIIGARVVWIDGAKEGKVGTKVGINTGGQVVCISLSVDVGRFVGAQGGWIGGAKGGRGSGRGAMGMLDGHVGGIGA
jgi:prepilin-type processing-associated H-X9-DG protein